MSDTNLQRWVSDTLYEVLGLSDRSLADFFISLGRKSASSEVFLEKIRDTNTIDVNEEVRRFAADLWNRIPREMSAGEKRKLDNR